MQAEAALLPARAFVRQAALQRVLDCIVQRELSKDEDGRCYFGPDTKELFSHDATMPPCHALSCNAAQIPKSSRISRNSKVYRWVCRYLLRCYCSLPLEYLSSSRQSGKYVMQRNTKEKTQEKLERVKLVEKLSPNTLIDCVTCDSG